MAQRAGAASSDEMPACSDGFRYHNAGQGEQLAKDAAMFVRLSVPAVFFIGISECLKRYLMAQGVVMPAAGVPPVPLAKLVE